MLSARKIGAWLTLLLFIGGLFAPSVLAARADCPMKKSVQKAHCAAMATPAPQTPSCCHSQDAQTIRAQTLTTGCCCTITAAPERAETPAVLSPISEPLTLAALLLPVPVPPVVAFPVVVFRSGDQTAPRAPPLRGSPTRAPPFS